MIYDIYYIACSKCRFVESVHMDRITTGISKQCDAVSMVSTSQFIVAHQDEHACAVCPWPALAREAIHANQSLLLQRVVVASGDIDLPVKRTLRMHIRVALTATLANAGHLAVLLLARLILLLLACSLMGLNAQMI